MDARERQILKALQATHFQTAQQIAHYAQVPRRTVPPVLKRLREDGLVVAMPIADNGAFGYRLTRDGRTIRG
jgi:predicted transcriptional regulator